MTKSIAVKITRPGYSVEVSVDGTANVFGATGRFLVDGCVNGKQLDRQREGRADISAAAFAAFQAHGVVFNGVCDWER
tara:strand:- start:3287 stop:3520 length:234 start_codon:yes stop_codon:yes gene_type:complete